MGVNSETRHSQSPSSSSRPTPKWLLRWAPFIVIGVLVVPLLWVDRHFKEGDIAGYGLPDASWEVEVADLSGSWRAWRNHPAYERFTSKGPDFLAELALAIRTQTGVRPTPERLGLWLGKHAVLTGSGASWILSVRPGVALRLASAVHGVVAGDTSSSIRTWGTLSYGWRDGFLVVSPSAAHVGRVLQDGRPVPVPATSSAGFTARWASPRAGQLEVSFAEGLPFALDLPVASGGDPGVLRRMEAWPDAVLLLEVAHGGDGRELVSAVESYLAPAVGETAGVLWASLAKPWWRGYAPPLPALECDGPQAFVLFPRDASGNESALRFGYRGNRSREDAGAAVSASPYARPFRWDALTGWLVSTPRHTVPWAVALSGDDVLLATDPTLVPTLANVPEADGQHGAFYLRGRWGASTRLARKTLLYLAEEELLPERNAEDVQTDWIPYLDGTGTLGSFSALGQWEDDGLRIDGQFARLEPAE